MPLSDFRKYHLDAGMGSVSNTFSKRLQAVLEAATPISEVSGSLQGLKSYQIILKLHAGY